MRATRLMNASLAVIAAILANMPQTAIAQSYNGTGEIKVGSGAIDVSTPNQTNVFVDSPVAVIDWTMSEPVASGPIDFQPVGTTATYINRDSTTLTVLNRILPKDPTRPIQFNGTVVSKLQDLATGLVTRGGTLFFYSPGGILVGPTGVFDVGSLVLTSSDLAVDPATGGFGSAGVYKFLPANPGSTVQVLNGAKIIAGPINAYVALVAPKVVNAGTITVDGSAVLVAADASTITFRPNGLFDIQIDQGTSASGEVVTNTGTIDGAAGSINVSHRIYVVAVPKNDAITMAIQGGSKLGFDIAGAANVDGNAIVLSAGYDIAGGAIASTRSPASGAVPATLTVGAIDATSQLTGQATGQASLQVQGGNAANFASNVNISGVTDPAEVSADGAFVSVSGVGSTLDIAGDLLVKSLDGGVVTGAGTTDSSAARIVVSDGRMTIVGSATADASRIGFGGQTSTGGEAALEAKSGAAVNIGKDLILSGDGVGQYVDDAITLGSFPGIGGEARLSFGGGAKLAISGNLALHANGFGGTVFVPGYAGADGTGGTALVEGLAGASTLTVSGLTTVEARGTGADGIICVVCVVEGGSGTGGSAGISVAPGARLDFGTDANIDASGFGGSASPTSGKAGGSATGGLAFVSSTGGAISAAESLSVLANGTGGLGAFTNAISSGTPGVGATGGSGTGGKATLSAGDALQIGGGGSISINGATLVSANGSGGDGGIGAAGKGGLAAVSARNGAASGADLSVQAIGLGGAASNSGSAGLGGAGGAGSGGSAHVSALSALEGSATVTFGAAAISARGIGGAGSTPTAVAGPGGAGGIGAGGSASALAEAGNGALSLGSVTINVSGSGGEGGLGGVDSSLSGGAGGTGGSGLGGSATFGMDSGLDTGGVHTGSATFAAASVFANGIGGAGGAGGASSVSGAPGNGGSAGGGGATLIARGGTVTISGAAEMLANAVGGDGGTGTGGDAAVGDSGGLTNPRGVRLEVGSRGGHADQIGKLVGKSLTFTATAEGGTGATAGSATVLGHPLTYLIDHGSIAADSLDFTATGTPAPGASASVIWLTGGDTALTGDFNFLSPGTLTVTLDGANLLAGKAAVSADDWQPGAVPAGSVGTLTGTTSVTLTTGKDLFGHLSILSNGNLALIAGGLIRLDNLKSQGDVSANAGTTIALGDISASSSVTVSAPGNVTVRAVSAGTNIALTSGGALAAGSAASGQSSRLQGTSSVAVGGAVVAGDAVTLVSDGAISSGGISAGFVAPSAAPGATYDITVFAKGAANLGDLSAAHDVKVFTPLSLTVGALAGRDIAVLAGGKEVIGSLASTGRALFADYAMTAVGGDPLGSFDLNAVFAAAPIAATGSITLLGNSTAASLTAATTGDLIAKAIGTAGSVGLEVGGNMSTGAMTAGGAISASSAGAMNLGSASASAVQLTSGSAMTAGDLTASAGTLTVTSGGNLAAGAMAGRDGVALTANGDSNLTGTVSSAAGNVSLAVLGALKGQAISSGQGAVAIDAKSSAAVGGISAAIGITLKSDGKITAGDINGSTIDVKAGTSLNVGAVTAATGTIALAAAGDLATEALAAPGAVSLASSGGSTAVAGAIAGGAGVSLAAAGDLNAQAITAVGALKAAGSNVTLGDAKAARIDVSTVGRADIGVTTTTAGDAAITAGSTLRSKSITAVGAIKLSGGGALQVGDLAAGGAVLVSASGNAAFGAARSRTGTVELRSTAGSLTAGAISAATDTALTATTDLDVGNVSARDILLLAGGSVRGDSITSSDSRILIANASLGLQGGAIGAYNFEAVFASPVRSAGGGATITGAVSGGALTAAVDGAVSLASADLTRTILIDSGAGVSLTGLVKAPQIEIRSSDLALPAGARLNAGANGSIRLVSRNAAGMRIGDGLDDSIVPASSYKLDDAEWSRINSGSLSLYGLDGAGTVDMLIGTLTVTGPDAGSTIDDPAGTVLFRTGETPAATPGGTIRVVGALGATGFRAENTLAFQADRFELASGTGSIAVLGIADTLSGAVRIEASDIHIAAAPLLAQLAADPFFAGAEAALDTQSAGGSQPVVRAGAFDLAVGRTLYLQRSGIGGDRFGFEGPLDGFKVRPAGAGPITVIINGTFRTAGGLVTDNAAWTLFKSSGADLSGFAADSRLNGCLLNAATCGAVPLPKPQPDSDPGIRTLIELLDEPGAGDTPPEDPDKPTPKNTNAIVPPQSLLAVQPDALPTQIDEAIAGSGNPGLIGAGIGTAGGPVQ